MPLYGLIYRSSKRLRDLDLTMMAYLFGTSLLWSMMSWGNTALALDVGLALKSNSVLEAYHWHPFQKTLLHLKNGDRTRSIMVQVVPDEPLSNESLSNESLSNESLSNESLSNESLSNESLSNESLSNESLSNEPLSNESLSNEPLPQILDRQPEEAPHSKNDQSGDEQPIQADINDVMTPEQGSEVIVLGQSDNSPYAIIIPGGKRELLQAVQEIIPTAFISASRRGRYVYTASFSERSLADAVTSQLRHLGFDAQVHYMSTD